MDRLLLPGMARFTNLGYKARARSFKALDDDLTDRVAVVTGATGGLGRATAESLAGLGASVVLVGRNGAKAETTASEIQAATGNDQVSIELADLSLMSEVRALAERLAASREQIHILVNNAGALFGERQETGEGIELTLATNLLSGFLLTNLLAEHLEASAPARVINVSSGGMYLQGISVSDLQYERGTYNGSRAYARTKRGQVILTQLWSEMLEGVTVNAMHPGWAATKGVEDALPGFNKVIRPLLRTADQGADTIVWLAASSEVAEVTGGFFLDREPHITEILGSTKVDRPQKLRLWKALANLSGFDGPAPAGIDDLS